MFTEKQVLVFSIVYQQPYIHQFDYIGFRQICHQLAQRVHFQGYRCSLCYGCHTLSFSSSFSESKILDNLYLMDTTPCTCISSYIIGEVYEELAFKAFYGWPYKDYLELRNILFEVS